MPAIFFFAAEHLYGVIVKSNFWAVPNHQKLEELRTQYQEILERLDELEEKEEIGAFDKRTIIDLSGDVIQEIARKYEKVQKGIGGMMRGALIETSARTILNQGIS